ncbi:hypothetical protein C5167_004492, partial [Papaver somniferum]
MFQIQEWYETELDEEPLPLLKLFFTISFRHYSEGSENTEALYNAVRDDFTEKGMIFALDKQRNVVCWAGLRSITSCIVKKVLCHWCLKRNPFTEKEVCIVCNAKYCSGCVLKVINFYWLHPFTAMELIALPDPVRQLHHFSLVILWCLAVASFNK